MSYRDDDDAARARADALQVELDQTREALAAAEAKLAQREAELAETEGLNSLLEARAEAKARKGGKGKGRKAAKKPINPNWYPFAGVVGILALCGVFYVMSGDRISERDRERNERDRGRRLALSVQDSQTEPEACTIHTIPEGAMLFSIGPGKTVEPLGKTPTFVPLNAWGRGVHVEARLTGYEPLLIFTLSGTGRPCNQTYSLSRAAP